MNLFLIALSAPEAVQDLCDKHVVKMILETAQILYSVWHVRHGLPDDPTLSDLPAYKKTHSNHPVSIWARDSVYHYTWTCMYGKLLCKEYTHRYGKIHKTEAHIDRLYRWGYPTKTLEDPPIKKKTKEWVYAKEGIPTQFDYFPLCMDEDSYVHDENGNYNAVLSYQKYYMTKQDKFKMAWTHSDKPYWFSK